MPVKKKILCGLFLTVLALGGLAVSGQQSRKVLTNDDVIKMVKEELSEAVIISVVQQSPANYDVSPDALIRMKKQGVGNKILEAMVQAGSSDRPHVETTGRQPAASKAPPGIAPIVRSDFAFELKACQSSGGDSVTCRLLVTNKAQERRLFITDDSYIMDDLGEQYAVADMWLGNSGKRFDFSGAHAGNTLIPETPMAAILKFQNVKPNATTLSVLRIACSWEGTRFNVDFRDVPISAKPQPSPAPNVEPSKKSSPPVRIGDDLVAPPKGAAGVVSNGNPVSRIAFKYRVKHFSFPDVREGLDLCAGTMAVGKNHLEIITGAGKSALGYECKFNTYQLTKDDLQKLKDTLDSKWYEYRPTADYIYVKFTVAERDGKGKKRKEFYVYPSAASITRGTRTHTLTGKVLVCSQCPAIVCRDCKEDLVAMKSLLDEFYDKE